jgi:hypothetical protein
MVKIIKILSVKKINRIIENIKSLLFIKNSILNYLLYKILLNTPSL